MSEHEILKRLDRIADGLDDMNGRLSVLEVNWKNTLRTWVRLERQGEERKRDLEQLKKKLTSPSPSWTLPDTR